MHPQSSNDTAAVHYIVHAHVPRGVLGSLKVWALDAYGRRSNETFFDFSVWWHLHGGQMPSRNTTVDIIPQGEIELRSLHISEFVLLQYARGTFAIFVQILRGFPLGEKHFSPLLARKGMKNAQR